MKFIGKKLLVYQFPIILEKLWFFWKCEIWGNFVKIWYFVNNCLIKARILKSFCIYMTHIIVIYLPYTTFLLIDFQLKQVWSSQFCVFTVKSPSVTQRSVSQETAFKKSKNPSVFFFFFFCKTAGSENSFILIESNFRFLIENNFRFLG